MIYFCVALCRIINLLGRFMFFLPSTVDSDGKSCIFCLFAFYRQARDDYNRVHGERIVGYFPKGEKGKMHVAALHTDAHVPFKAITYI